MPDKHPGLWRFENQPDFIIFRGKYYAEVYSNPKKMQTYILLTKLSPDLTRQMKDRARIGKSWIDQVKEKCPEVKFISHYALLGQYDFLDIYEAPDEETAAKVSMISQKNGALQAQSLIAIPYKRFVELTESI